MTSIAGGRLLIVWATVHLSEGSFAEKYRHRVRDRVRVRVRARIRVRFRVRFSVKFRNLHNYISDK